LFDLVDGRIARLTKTTTEIGIQLDSIADVVTFGIAPAVLAYVWGYGASLTEGSDLHRLAWFLSFMYLICGAFRLARFNSNVAQDRRFFQGLASPAAAAGIASMIWIATSYEAFEGLAALGAGVAITAVTGLLMMSRFAYMSFKDVNPGKRVRFAQRFLILLVLIVVAFRPAETIFALFVVYAASGPTAWSWHRRRAKRHETVTQQ